MPTPQAPAKTPAKVVRGQVMTLDLSEVRNAFRVWLQRIRAHQHRIVLTRYGKPVAALVPIEDLERLTGQTFTNK